MHSNPLGAYEKVNKMTMSGRDLEATVLSKAADKLKQCQQNWDASDREQALEEALSYNQRIWSVFQGELSREDNPLPKDLRRDILRLSAFVDRRIFDIIASPSPERLNMVIRINENIAAGLRGSAAENE